MGTRCISGDDKCLTYLVLKRRYSTWAQLDAIVYSTFQPSATGFIKQRVRWARNTYRSDIKFVFSKWAWRHPYLCVLLIDKAIAPFAQTIGLAFFLGTAIYGVWELMLIQLLWWHVSRAIKITPHLRRRPKSIFLLPAFIIVAIGTCLVKIYSAFTLFRHGWLTR